MKIQRILEAFDSSPYRYRHSGLEGEHHSYVFKTDDGSKVDVYFESLGEEDKDNSGEWYMEFSRSYPLKYGSRFKKTGTGDAWRIYATVLEAARDFINEENPEMVVFSSEKEGGDSDSRTRLYDRMIKRFANQMGYVLADKQSDSMSTSYTLKRK